MAEIRLSGIYKEYDLHTYGLEDVSLTFAEGLPAAARARCSISSAA